QLQSRLVCLPTEIKHMITLWCFTADDKVENPATNSGCGQKNTVPSLGAALLQTCRRLNYEIDRRPLYSQNAFSFTTVDKARQFLKSLDYGYRLDVNDLEIDIRNVHSDHPAVAREWLQYLAWEDYPNCEAQASLKKDAPGLKTLRLNFESWPRIPMFRAELWNLLRNLMSNVKGLEKIVVIGASKGQSMARRAPWSPAHYVGADDI
ncbi:hypothetical protein CC86DRAFT_253042, partial [Ophiobolus disseminans]